MGEPSARERIRAEIEGYAAFDGIRRINAEMLAARIEALVVTGTGATSPEIAGPGRGPWRTGRHPVDEPGPRGRTLYDADGEFVGLMDSKALADRVVAAVNGATEHPDAPSYADLVQAEADVRAELERFQISAAQAVSDRIRAEAKVRELREDLTPLTQCLAPRTGIDYGIDCGACVACRVRAALLRPAWEMRGA